VKTKTSENRQCCCFGVELTAKKIRPGLYILFSPNQSPLGLIRKRLDDWYGEVHYQGKQFANSCGESLTDVISDLGYNAYQKGKSPRRVKEDAAWASRLIGEINHVLSKQEQLTQPV
jgi:hypothetical protein